MKYLFSCAWIVGPCLPRHRQIRSILLPSPEPSIALATNPSHFCSERLTEADIIVDHRVRSDRNSSWVGQIEFAENDLVTPDLTKEILEYLDRQLFTGTAAVAETKWREASIVTHRLRLTIHYAEYRAETAVGYLDLSSIFDFKSGDIKWAAGKPYLLGFLLVNLGTGRYIEIALGIELFWILPMYWTETGAGVRCADIAISFEREAKACVRVYRQILDSSADRRKQSPFRHTSVDTDPE